MAELFDNFTAVWDSIDGGALSDWLAGQLDTGHRAVDLGCGAGRHTPILADRYQQVLGVDVSQRMLDLARKNHASPSVTYRRASVLDINPEADGVFDAVVSVAALHHVGPPERVLAHVRTLVAPGGRLVVVDMVDPGGRGTLEWHIDRAFSDARVAYQLTGSADKAIVVLQQLLAPSWLAMVVRDVPVTRDQFHAHYAAAFPGALFTDDLHPLMAGMSWTAPTAADS
jgi:SAM-dependent methyltransferase